MEPQLSIEVDPQTGIWSTDGLPMIYVPRHFFVNNHEAIVQAVGVEKYADQVYQAGYKSAYFWCASEAKHHTISGMDVFHHYLKRLSQRGWGQFTTLSGSVPDTLIKISLKNSVFPLHYQGFDQKEHQGQRVCFMFAGWFAGSLDWVADNLGESIRYRSSECCCVMEGEESCQFNVVPVE